ncbi:MAG: hypothetical protein JW785_04755 [Acidimicrobiia bacterium]|nr:hypothetical protein [Acidimicrobiia bacterium]
MRGLRTLILVTVAALAVTVAACGDDDATSTGPPAPTTTTTLPPATTGASVTTTSAPPTTTTETAPDDLHPVWGMPPGISWSEFWPGDGETALYRATGRDGSEVDIPVTMSKGIEHAGGTWDRLSFGAPEPGGTGLILYLRDDEPWTLTMWGMESYAPDFPAADWILTEWFDEPVSFGLATYPVDPDRIEAGMNLKTKPDDPGFRLPMYFDLHYGEAAETLEVPYGAVEGALHVTATWGGEFIGGEGYAEETVDFDVWLHPELFLVRLFIQTNDWEKIELVEPWT